jgi:chromosomal replication initiation ATPase DnaA
MNAVNYYTIPGIKRDPVVHFERSVKNIVSLVCEMSGVSHESLYGSRGSTRVTNAKFIACRLLHKYSGLSKADIGREFNKDHGTIINALRQYESFYKTDEAFRFLVDTITAIIEK